jgi:peptidyl-prolyl cis-trans isomerase A (cyclophilin A)
MRVCAKTACLALGSLLTFTSAFAMQATTTPAKPATQKPATGTAKPVTQKPATAKPATAKPASAALRNPAALKEAAPATFNVNFVTTAGSFVVQVTRAWAPKGADRFYNLVKHGYYNDSRFFRVVPNFMVQFGINGDPKLQDVWREANIADDPVTQSNKRGFVTFAKRNAPNSRSTQVFINFKDNSGLDGQGFAPFGQVISGMEVVDKINAEYGEEPDQGRIQFEGNAYLAKEFPRLTVMKSVTIARPASATAKPAATTPKPAAKPPVKK